MTIEIIGLYFLVMVNICVVAFSFGKITAKVVELGRRVDKIEKKVFP